jgi:hypothetical protein
MAGARNSDNVRVYGSLNDAIWIAPLGTTLPTTLALDLPEPWVALGWLGQSGIPLAMSTDIEKFKGHQGGATIRTKVTSTEKTLSFVCLEETPAVVQLYHNTSGVPTVTGTAPSQVAKIDLPESVGVVAVACVIQLQDGDVTKFYCLERIEITNREDVAHSNTELTGYGMSAEIIGDSYLLTNAQPFIDAGTVTP